MKPGTSERFPFAAGTNRKEEGLATRLIFCAGLALALIALWFHPVAAQTARSSAEVAQLEERLAAQEALLAKLLQRLEAIEASQARILERKAEVSETASSDESVPPEQEQVLSELRDDLEELEQRLALRPTVGGYYDFEYIDDDRPASPGAFRQHHVTLLLSKEYEKFRMFSEIEFEFGTRFVGTGGTNLTTARGEMKVEQGWGEYVFSDQLKLRGGLILTPGYWNVHHWPNLVLSTRRPLMVRRIYPESFAGVMGHGSRYWGEFGLTYYGYVGNGESDNFAEEDNNEDKAVGGKFSFHLPTRKVFRTFDLGVSGYTDEPLGVERTQTWGLDAQIRKGRFEFLSEFATRKAQEDRSGFYFQPGYRFIPRLTGFYRFDQLDLQIGGRTREHTVGIDFRPTTEVSLKVEFFRSNPALAVSRNGVATSIVIAY